MSDHDCPAASELPGSELPGSEVVRALTAPGSEQELRGEEAAVAAFRSAAHATRPRHRGRLRLASGLGATAAASTLLLSVTVATAAAYTASLPREAQRTAHHLFRRLGVPAPAEHRPQGSGRQAAGWPPHARTGVGEAVVTPPARPSAHGLAPVGRPAVTGLVLRLDHAVVLVGQSVHLDVQEQGVPPARPGSTALPGPQGTVEVEVRSPGGRTWAVARRARLVGSGATAVLGPVQLAVELRAVLTTPDGTSVTSAVRAVRARPLLSLHAASTPVLTLALSSDAGQRSRTVLLQEQVAGAWEDVLRAVVDAAGHAAFHLPDGQGRRTYRAVLPACPLFDAAVSAPVTVTRP